MRYMSKTMIKTKTCIGDIFDTDDMRALIHDYALTHPDIADIESIGDLNRTIFSTARFYAGFLQFMQEQGFGQKLGEVYDSKQQYKFLLLMERVRQEMRTVQTNISQILDILDEEIHQEAE